MPQDTQTPGASSGIRWAANSADTGASGCVPAKQYGPDPSCQPCPDCGGLECLCRPRFFAGQLLTEKDLNRLDQYMTAKHKLHNRHLHGSGVVCGLIASCDPCGDNVNVSPGYALSPCGEDIVVCEPDTVDICALIARCRNNDGPDCRPYANHDQCDEVEEEWILAIRYAEYPSLPKTPLVGAQSCSCSTGSCGGSCGGKCGSAGCSCASGGAQATGTQTQTTPNQPRLRRGAETSCEPTVTCESYRYDVFKPPQAGDPGGPRDPNSTTDGDDAFFISSLSGLFDNLEGEMARRIYCCLKDLEAAIPRPPGELEDVTAESRQAWFRWCCSVRSSLKTYLTRSGGSDCESIAKLSAIPCPDPSLPIGQFQSSLVSSVLAMLEPTFQALLHCICTNMLPPCPAPGDPRVPLAVVTVRGSDCQVIKVCNWTPLREHVLTFPTLSYWFGWIPLARMLREFIESLCCSILDFNFDDNFDQQTDATINTEESGNFDDVQPVGEQPVTEQPVMAQPISLTWEPSGKKSGFFMSALLNTMLAAPIEGERAPLSRADLFDLTFRRPAIATPEGLDENDKEAVEARLAGSGLVRSLAEVVRGGLSSSAKAIAPRGLTELAGFGGLAAATMSKPAKANATTKAETALKAATAIADIANLRKAMEAQAKDIEALKAQASAVSSEAPPASPPSSAPERAPAGTAKRKTAAAAPKKRTIARKTAKKPRKS
ncbi:hypothetical protein [Erythrobacter ani]|uniref:Uncharacterized protein n=1 Tax=Erythrobacter ani TaxID=2827235 RepID=A0ABS6SP20_9SPHN|nr:hypothetical protein [Erythrobacter ani]MBV7266237.1 hypothetical protein [Erythrobacter ani]